MRFDLFERSWLGCRAMMCIKHKLLYRKIIKVQEDEVTCQVYAVTKRYDLGLKAFRLTPKAHTQTHRAASSQHRSCLSYKVLGQKSKSPDSKTGLLATSQLTHTELMLLCSMRVRDEKNNKEF